MKKLLILLLLVGCETADNRPHRQATGFSCEGGGKYLYYVGADSTKSQFKSFPTQAAAARSAQRDGCTVDGDQTERLGSTVVACCPRTP